MANTPSNMLELGTNAPDFKLFNPKNNSYNSLTELKSDIATVIMFICNHCPFVIHINEVLVKLSNEYIEKGISFIAINSNDIEKYPSDSPEKMLEIIDKYGYNFSYLFDESQETAKAYKAACTPDFYIFNKEMSLVYRGQFDDSRPGNNIPVTGSDIKNALDAILNNKLINEFQKPSIGCNIKWR